MTSLGAANRRRCVNNTVRLRYIQRVAILLVDYKHGACAASSVIDCSWYRDSATATTGHAVRSPEPCSQACSNAQARAHINTYACRAAAAAGMNAGSSAAIGCRCCCCNAQPRCQSSHTNQLHGRMKRKTEAVHSSSPRPPRASRRRSVCVGSTRSRSGAGWVVQLGATAAAAAAQ